MFRDNRAFSSFAVPDLEVARDFYGKTLGLDVSDAPMGVLEMHVSGGHNIMVYPKPDHAPAVFTILNFVVDDIDQAVDDLSARGVRFERYEGFNQDEKGIARDDGNDGPGGIAWFKDPAGNILAVIKE